MEVDEEETVVMEEEEAGVEAEGVTEVEAGMEVEAAVGIQAEAHTVLALGVGAPAARCMDQEIESRRPEKDDPSTSQVIDLRLNRK